MRGVCGCARLFKALRASLQGLRAAYGNEAAFRQEVWLAVFLIPVGGYIGASGAEKALLVASVILVLIVELLNSALEAAIDRIGAEWHELSARAKDMGSAAVLLALLQLFLVWGLLLLF